MKTDFEATVEHEIDGEDGNKVLTFNIGLHCSAPSFPGYFDPATGGEPPSGPEFDLTYIQHDGKEIKWDDLVKLVGVDAADSIYDRADEQAYESGEF